MRLSVLTWNIWDTPYFGSLDNDQRVDKLVNHLYTTEPDIVLIQESFNVERRKKFLEKIGRYDSGYQVPENVYGERRILGLIPFFDATGGLVTLSRHPIEGSAFARFEAHGKTWDERFCGKGYAKTFVNLSGRKILVVNTHLSNRPTDTEIRMRQLEQVLEDLKEDVPVILGGDFNSTRFLEGRQTKEFDRLQYAGFKDSLVGREEDFETFSHRNKYNRHPEQGRIDFVFFRGRIKPMGSKLLGVGDPISDHYGYLAELEIDRD